MEEGGIVGCEAPHRPLRPLHAHTRAGLLELARSLYPLVLRLAI
jgi:4-hydroxy-tetrahydrodipicolinate synthase